MGAATAPAAGATAGPGDLVVKCALPYQTGKPGSDCVGSHNIVFSTAGTSPDAKVTAELLALDLSGFVLGSLKVQNGDAAQLKSRLQKSDWKLETKNNGHEVSAPIPLLRVTVEDQGQKVQAFCSNIPYLQVIEPKNTVISESDGNVTKLVAAAPLVDGHSLEVKVDGVNIFDAAHLNISDPSVCTADSPCGGTTTIGGVSVTIADIVVDLTTGIGILASNTVSMTLEGLACGGHVYVINGVKLAGTLKNPTSTQCHVNDLRDKGTSSVFAINITSPTPGEITSVVPTPVVGEVCAGRKIVNVQLNGIDANIGGQTCTAGDGENSGDTCVVPINAALGQTNLTQDLDFGDVPPGTFDEGTNRLVASARDDQGTRTFKKVIFATGDVIPIGVDPSALLAQVGLENTMKEELQKKLAPTIQNALTATETEIQNAFVVGISAQGAQKLFDQLCTAPLNDPASPFNGKTPGQIFSETVTTALEAFDISNPLVTQELDLGACPSCNPTFRVYVDDVTVGTNVSCPLTFQDDFFNVKLQLPDIFVRAKASGHCRTDLCGPLGCVCIAETTVDLTAEFNITGIFLSLNVTEDNLLQKTKDPAPDFQTGARVDLGVTGGVDFDCIGGVICGWAIDIIEFFSGNDDLLHIDIEEEIEFSQQITASKPDPVELNEIKVDEQVVANFDQKLQGAVSSVVINDKGIAAGLRGTFATLKVDPEVELTPGLLRLTPPIPQLPLPNGQDVFVGLQSTTFNMLFASMTAAGNLKAECNDTGKTVGNLLDLNASGTSDKADCDTLTLDNDVATAAARATCYGVLNVNCESLAFADPTITSGAQGVCHSLQGHDCSTIPLSADGFQAFTEQQLCAITPNPNIHANQKILFCARQDVPPRLLLEDNAGTQAVEAALRLNDLTVGIVLDRTGPLGVPDGKLDGPLAAAPACFGTATPTNGDCSLFATCLDLNFDFSMQSNPACPGGTPGFLFNPIELQILNRSPGVVCGASGTTAGGDDDIVDSAATDNVIKIDLKNVAKDAAPPICGAGLDLGGFITCSSPELLALETDGFARLKDYLAISCKIQ